MPLAISLGLGSQAIPFVVPAIENINGQGITLAVKHKDRRDPKQVKGLRRPTTAPENAPVTGPDAPGRR